METCKLYKQGCRFFNRRELCHKEKVLSLPLVQPFVLYTTKSIEDEKIEPGLCPMEPQSLCSDTAYINMKFEKRNGRHEPTNLNRCGRVMESFLRHTYSKMKERQLVGNDKAFHTTKICKDTLDSSSHQTSYQNLLTLENTFYPVKKHFSVRSAFQKNFSQPPVTTLPDESTLGTKELFFRKMQLKYQNPSEELVWSLTQKYPESQKLFEAVVGSLAEASGISLPKPILTSHLKQMYWKASLHLPLFHLSVSATHPNKEQAEKAVYLRACQKFEELGLMWHNGDRHWRPMTCEKAIMMLETLSKYVDSSLVPARGRGVKIILNQAKKTFSGGKSASEQKVNHPDEFKMHLNDLKGTFEANRSTSSPSSNTEHAHGTDTFSEYHYSQSALTEQLLVSKKFDAADKTSTFSINASCNRSGPELNFSTNNSEGKGFKTLWQCTIHVGWPFPFSVKVLGVSLPGAQLLGYMTLVSKLKIFGLLTPSNCSISSGVLGCLMRLDVQKLFDQSMLSDTCHKYKDFKSKSDAELFSDASFTGLGAYLILDNIHKVSWLSQSWKEHDESLLSLIGTSCRSFDSELSEMHAIITAIFSWKKKLRGRKIVCLNDNQTVVKLINSLHQNKAIPPEQCMTAIERLISDLQVICATYSIELHAAWLHRDKNFLADALSRGEVDTFHSYMPHASNKSTTAKRLSIPWHLYYQKMPKPL